MTFFLMSHVTEFHVTLRQHDRTEPSFSDASLSPSPKCWHPKEEDGGRGYSVPDDSVTTLKGKVTQQSSLCIITKKKDHF